MIVCGASFAGLAVARELAGSGADVLVLDRYEIGERQTSACAAPTAWLRGARPRALDPADVPGPRDPHAAADAALGSPVDASRRSTTASSARCCGSVRRRAVRDGDGQRALGGRGRGRSSCTPTRDLQAPLVVDALGWRRVLSTAPDAIQPPKATLSRGLEVHPAATGEDFELWLDPRYVPKGYSGRSPPGTRCASASARSTRASTCASPTVRLARDIGVPPDGFQGNWIPHKLRRATEDGVFFVGDSAGHCIPATAEGIRPAFYFGAVCGRELAMVIAGRQTRAQALERYDSRSEEKRYAYRSMLRAQRFVGRATPYPLMTSVLEAVRQPALGAPRVRPLRRHLPAAEPRGRGRRPRALAHDQVDADREQRDADELAGGQRLARHAEQAEAVDDDRRGELTGDDRGRHAARAEVPDGDDRRASTTATPHAPPTSAHHGALGSRAGLRTRRPRPRRSA